MTFTRSTSLALVAVLISLSPGIARAEGNSLPVSVRSFDSGTDGAYFAASIGPIEQPSARAAGVEAVLIVDTSASQNGVYRETVLAAVRACLSSLGPNDLVQLLAADLNARSMTEGPISPQSVAAENALSKLTAIAPLGTTDLEGALHSAAGLFDTSSNHQRVILYLGDGISGTGQLVGERLGNLARGLHEQRVAVSSYAVGPQRDASLLARLANLTGGNLYIDDPMVWADPSQGLTLERATQENTSRGGRVGRTLAAWAQAQVVWPEALSAVSGIAEVYPQTMPPLRSDRDTVLVGTLASGAKAIELAATIDGQPANWSSSLSTSNEANAFLATLAQHAARDGGVSLTTLGTGGLEETGRNLLAQVDQMTQLAERAASLGDAEGAAQISQAVLHRDPGNLRAQTVQRFVKQGASTPDTAPEGLSLIRTAQLEVLNAPPVESILAPPHQEEFFIEPSGPELSGPGVEYFDDGSYPPTEVVIDGRFLNSVERNSSVYAQLLEKEVQNAIVDARDEMRENPKGAMQRLKLMLLNVERAPELVASVRAGLIDRLQTTLRQADHAAYIKDDLDRQREETLAAARERKLLLDRFTQKQEHKRQLIAKFNALVDERRFAEAEEVAEIAEDLDQDAVVPRVARLWGRAKHYYEFNQQMREKRDAGFIDAMAGVERSAVPFSDSTPIVYPDAEFWLDLTERRKEYSSVDLAGKSESEEAISEALTSPLTSAGLDFQDTALEEVIDYLREEYQIEIQLDTAGLDDLGIQSDEPITVNLRNITLRSALRLMLKPLELTYVIDDEVLLITSEDEALTRLSVKVYPVADLVIPIITQPPGGIGGGGGGQGGGGGGFGGGGGGGGQGGGGGGGGGFGGGGGAFSIPDGDQAQAPKATPVRKLTLSAATESPAEPTPAATNKPALVADSIELPQTGADAAAWDAIFSAENTPDPSTVRNATRRLMVDTRYADVVLLINSALRNNAAQPWMYESLGIALQLRGGDQAEVERAILSAVDFATSADHLLVIADYLKGIGLDRRAVEVCRLAVERDPMLHEGYALALRAAQRSNDVDAIGWASTAILARAWPQEHAPIEQAAHLAVEGLLTKLDAAGQTEQAKSLRDQLHKAKTRDCVIRVRWTGEADVDIAVQEPGGSVCSSLATRSASGGVSLGDSATTVGGEHCETYVCPEGFSGDYQLAVRKVWGDVTADTVTVEITLAEGTDKQIYGSQQFRLNDKEQVIQFNLAEGRRNEPIEAQQVARAAERQRAISQAVLSQQLGSLAGDSPTSLRPDELRRRRRALAQSGSGVGFQPVIITLPEGTQFTTTAVVSADRRYVRVSPTPVFSDIPEVSTFSFTSAASNITNNTTNNTTANNTNNTNLGNNQGN